MATSSKVRFTLSHLQARAVETIENKIESAQLEFDSLNDPEKYDELVAKWKVTQEDRIRAFARRLDTAEGVSESELERFKIAPRPDNDSYEHRDVMRRLERLKSRRDEIVAKSSSLVADEDGTIALTKTQLQEFFGL